ncbi:hypothetical protein M408DRAFT_30684 [Serendipita vermifera MAFF 305830]|uniref:Uncharacterized protein n=1 Tax=Serendipita vermifera MAFF 305830 TaxID=933852 RepID=A0A0C2WR40_SERVB|nr:hypothetical protein M408DRAFT_30684 [Serendipita vermifera MAFF 305830]
MMTRGPSSRASQHEEESEPPDSNYEQELVKPEVKAAALLLTTAPIYSLRDDFDKISELGPHFYTFGEGVRVWLRDDPNVERLQGTLRKLNVPMNLAAREIESCFISARLYYIHRSDEMAPPTDGFGQVTEEQVAKLLNPQFQEMVIRHARKAAIQAAKAAKIIREEVMPIFPQLEYDLECYVDNYVGRIYVNQMRQESMVPLLLHNLLFGAIPPTPWSEKQVRDLPRYLQLGKDLLHQLPAFLDNFELHCQRLLKIRPQQFVDLGYTTFDDATRLYQDRLKCNQALAHMGLSWFTSIEAFIP